jgi:hypothetical protein
LNKKEKLIVAGRFSGVTKWLGLYARSVPGSRSKAGAMELSAKIVDVRSPPVN